MDTALSDFETTLPKLPVVLQNFPPSPGWPSILNIVEPSGISFSIKLLPNSTGAPSPISNVCPT